MEGRDVGVALVERGRRAMQNDGKVVLREYGGHGGRAAATAMRKSGEMEWKKTP